MMHIRRAHESEAGLLSSIAFAAKGHWPYSPAQLLAWREDLTVTAEMVAACPAWVAEVDGEVVGFFVLASASPSWSLEHLWVLPSHMGRGVGRALLAQAARLAAEGGACGLAIDADPYAEPFYRACGAERVGSIAAPIAGEPQRVRPQLELRLRPGPAAMQRGCSSTPPGASPSAGL